MATRLSKRVLQSIVCGPHFCPEVCCREIDGPDKGQCKTMKAVKLGPSLYSSLICNQGLKALGAFEIGLKKQDRGILTGGGVILRFAPPRNIPVYTLVYSTRNKKFVAFSWLAAIMCMTNSLSNRFYVSGRHNNCKHKWRSSEHSFFLWHSDQEKFLFFGAGREQIQKLV